MTIVRRIARPLLAAQFVAGGVDQIRNPESRAENARPLVERLAKASSSLPDDPTVLVRVNGGVMVGAGSLLALNKLPRIAGFALAATLLPTTIAGHRFWEEKDPQARGEQKMHFLKNLGLLGGTLLAAVDTEGRPGVAWRARHAGRSAQRQARHARQGVARQATSAQREARLAARQVKRDAQLAGNRAGRSVKR